MSHALSKIKGLPNHELFKLKLVRTENPVTLVAVLTQRAVNLGVRFDNHRKDYRFNLSEFLGNDDGDWSNGSHFEATANNIELDLSDRENRCLVADLLVVQDNGRSNKGMKYNLDKVIGLVDYDHPVEKETYFRLGVKNQDSLSRTLVLCFDGTSNHFSNRNTNVVKMFELLKKDDPGRQMVYYQTGIGTYTSPAWTDAITQKVATTLDRGVAWYLYQHVGLLPSHNVEHIPFAYKLYASGGRKEEKDKKEENQEEEYMEEEDGWWNRAKFRARETLGVALPFLNKPIGDGYHEVLQQEEEPEYFGEPIPMESDDEFEQDESDPNEYIPEEFPCLGKSYLDEFEQGGPNGGPIPDEEISEKVAPSNAPLVGNPPDVAPPRKRYDPNLERHNRYGALGEGGDPSPKNTQPEAYKQTFCTPIVIDFVGVWDTVGSVGAIIPQTLPFIDYNPSILVFRHALALDEHRANFVPSLWDHTKTQKEYQNVREVWFRGQHSDIGGGSRPPVDSRNSHSVPFTKLGNIPLRWMVQQCLENNISIAFDQSAMELYRNEGVLERRPARPTFLAYRDGFGYLLPIMRQFNQETIRKVNRGEIPMSKETRSQILYEVAAHDYDRLDVKHEPFESAGKFSPWNFLEFVPSARPYQAEEGPELTHWPNLFKPRQVYRRNPNDPVYIHASVANFITTEDGATYRPNVTWRGYKNEEFPKIESFEGNPNTEPSDKQKAALKTALRLGWNETPTKWAQAKSSVASTGNKIKKLFGFGSSD
ncbi:unnamed protein product [Rhizoctonia solani]|uniref:T6SS Phospholipase effector Tle1-like catalytic domain-containing protein n=1 Tax=Rhizoctonia solani TaxID=456999 RepID=A0A8H3BS06_9AGAM|nr:unnamed protein product [Rhizoctonia solani]